MRPRRARALALPIAVAIALAAPLAAAQASDYRFDFVVQDSLEASAEGRTAAATGEDVAFSASVANLTTLDVEFKWKTVDDGGFDPLVRFTLTSPEGRVLGPYEKRAHEGRVHLDVDLNGVPDEVRLRADSDEEAWRKFHAEAPPRTLGRGTWTARVDVEGFPGDDEGFFETSDVEWTLKVEGKAYAGRLVEKAPVRALPSPPTNPTPPPQPPSLSPSPSAPPTPEEAAPIGDNGRFPTWALALGGAAAGILAALAIGLRRPPST